MKTQLLTACLLVVSLSAGAQMDPMKPETLTHQQEHEKTSGENMGAIKKAKVFFVEPKDGATVTSPLKVKMGVEGLRIRPAGEAVDDITSGHHHLIIDGKPLAAGQPIPMDDQHMHFGKGQTETTVSLSPGKHTLILQFADGAHRSFGPKLMQKIEITVLPQK